MSVVNLVFGNKYQFKVIFGNKYQF